MEIFVKIDRSTIRENPDAGKTTFVTRGPKEVSGSYFGPIPDSIADHVIITTTNMQDGRITEQEFVVNGDPAPIIHQLNVDASEGKAAINIHHNNTEIYHTSPQPKYLYEYDHFVINCHHCHKDFNTADLEIDDDGNYCCPHCGYTYDVGFERIRDVESPRTTVPGKGIV